MKCALVIFSPTGGTERAARLLCEGLGPVERVIDLMDPSFAGAEVTAEADMVAVIVMPAFEGRMPGPAADRLKQVKGNGIPCVVVGVYGNRAYEDLLKEMEVVARADGFRVAAAVAAVAEHSTMHCYATGRPDEADGANLLGMGRRIAEKLAGPWNEGALKVPGKMPKGEAHPFGMNPRATSACVECGVCAQVCPIGAIDPKNPRVADKRRCITCMRCVVSCPHNARECSPVMLSALTFMLKPFCSGRKEYELYL